MATQALAQPRWVRRRGVAGTRTFRGGAEETGLLVEAASQSFKAGALLQLSSGKFAIAVGTEGTPSLIAAQAMADATGTTNADIFVAPISPLDIFVMNVYHGTAASAITALSQLGTAYGIKLVSGKWHVDIETTTVEDATHSDARVNVIGFWPEDAIGDIYGRVLVEFIQMSTASDGVPNQRTLQMA